MRLDAWLLVLALAGTGAAAQNLAPENPDWKEVEAPAPPPLRTSGLVAFDVQGSSLKYGVDPDSITVGTDGVVRYVLVAYNAEGVANGMYEGINCRRADVKVYARHDAAKGWVQVRDPQWTSLNEGLHARTSMQVARNGACLHRTPNGSPRQIIQDLRAGDSRRFGSSP